MSTLRVKELVSPRLWAVYLPSESVYMSSEAPYNQETADNILTYYESFDDLQKVVNDLEAHGVPCIELYPMWEVIDMLADDEFFIGNGKLLWVEIGGDGVPAGVTRCGFDNR